MLWSKKKNIWLQNIYWGKTAMEKLNNEGKFLLFVWQRERAWFMTTIILMSLINWYVVISDELHHHLKHCHTESSAWIGCWILVQYSAFLLFHCVFLLVHTQWFQFMRDCDPCACTLVLFIQFSFWFVCFSSTANIGQFFPPFFHIYLCM